MNTQYRKPLPGTEPSTNLDYFDTRAAIDSIAAGAYDRPALHLARAGRKPGAPLRPG